MKAETISIDRLGPCSIVSPLSGRDDAGFISGLDNILVNIHKKEIENYISGECFKYFELAGPRRKIFFDPQEITCAIVTCGGLCPGINDVIRGLVFELSQGYGVKKIIGFRYGYRGIAQSAEIVPVNLDPELVDAIHTRGGTILSSSRGPQDPAIMVDNLVERGVKLLFTVGGDGTMKGATDIAGYIRERGLGISVIAIPKTIDNDINFVSRSFGFETAVQAAADIIENAHVESKGAPNGVGIVKVMGRTAGFIASYTALANRNVNYCFIPEKKFRLKGAGGFLEVLKDRLERKNHAVIVVTEGAGQDLIEAPAGSEAKDASGNIRLKNIGSFLVNEIKSYFKKVGVEINLKYIDPSYIIRSVPANAMDSLYCVYLSHYAVHAGMTGRTNMLVSYWNAHYIHLPIPLVTEASNKVDPQGRLWRTVMDATYQPASLFED